MTISTVIALHSSKENIAKRKLMSATRILAKMEDPVCQLENTLLNVNADQAGKESFVKETLMIV